MPPSPQSTQDPTSDEESTASQPPGSLSVLASLVILPVFFFVFAAITCRSFVHRRRRRRMVGEAVRNSKEDVDLLKKPRMWEIHLGGDDVTRGCGFIDAGGEMAGGGLGEVWYLHWDAIQPFSAVKVDPTRVSDLQGINITDYLTGSDVNFRHLATTPTSPRRLLSRITGVMNQTLSSISSPLSTPTNATASAPNNDRNNNTTITIPPEPSIVRIAVLIAMPSKRPQSQPSSPSPASTLHTLKSWHADAEEELPYVSVGVAELHVLTTDSGLEENKPKDSIGTSIQFLHSTGSQIKRPFLNIVDRHLLPSHF